MTPEGERLDVLVYGGTGSQARPTVFNLLQKGHTPHVLTRSPEDAHDLEAAGARLVAGDLAERDAVRAASNAVDAIAFLLPAFLDRPDEALAYGRNAVDAAADAGVRMFAWNVSGPLPEAGSQDARGDIFAHLQDAGLPYLLLEPTTYMENWLGPWTAPAVRNENLLSYPVLADRKTGWIASRDVAALVVAAIERPEVAGNRFSVSGLETPTGPELAGIFSGALGRKIDYYAMAPEEMGAVLDREFGPGSGDRIAEMYRREQQDPNPEPKYHDMTAVLEKLPVRMTTIFEWVSAHASAFNEADT